MNYIGEQSYLAIKPESTPGVAVVPTIFIPIVEADMKTVVNHEPDRRMKGISWKSNGMLRGNRSHEGTITLLGDPDTMGHVLNMLMTKGSTTGDADGYTHPFTVGNGDSYTFDIKKGNHVQRFFGVYIEEVAMEFADGQLQVTLTVKAMGQFSVASVGVALSGSVTELILDDQYDISPNRGLVVGDVITVGGVDLTLTSVDADGITVGFSSTAVTAAVGLPVLLKPQTVSFSTLQDPFYFGNLLVGFGADTSAAATAAGARSTATPCYDMKLTFKNNLFAQNGTNRMDPVQIIPRTKEAQISLKQLFTGVEQKQAWLDRSKQALTLVFFGKYIKSDFTTQEKLTLTFNHVKLLENNNEIKVGEMVVDDESFEVLYDNSDGQAMAASLINRTAGTVY